MQEKPGGSCWRKGEFPLHDNMVVLVTRQVSRTVGSPVACKASEFQRARGKSKGCKGDSKGKCKGHLSDMQNC